ncbi:NAD-dependent epimerase/dehydratase family protein [Ornithinimicrobium cryptoxanthini]|uniref:NAD-dependent epimerase/dehydratase family protein n=1 Tax=Ornithinimicrobium cryptoxanthini TaxID=2934161 RepID=UPI00211898D4|nr:NAD(P)-dependent oxidoreductase [Ornithinimicrobium cryptoxanthini]
MKVIVAGAAGLLGRYVLDRLRATGHHALGLSRTGAGGHAVTDYSVASLVPLLAGADAVVDLAATRPRPGAQPDMTSTVVTGTHLLEAAGRAGVVTLVQASSVSVYDPAAPRPLTEDSPTLPRTAYGLAKLTVERWAGLDEHAAIRTVSLRVSHLLGGRDDTGYLVSTYLKLAADGKDLPVHEPLGPARDLLYAGDAARAIELALTTPTARGPFNVAGLHLLTPAQLAQAVSDTVGGRVVGGDPAWRHAPSRPTSDEVSTDRVRDVLGFTPAHDVRSALVEIREELDRDRSLCPGA